MLYTISLLLLIIKTQTIHGLCRKSCLGILECEQVNVLPRENSTSTDSMEMKVINYEQEPLHEVDNHLSAEQCVAPDEFLREQYKTVINPYKIHKDDEPDTNIFRSVWLKCAACLAIADKINQTLQQFINASKTLDDINEDFSEGLRNMCQKQFKTYDLREYKGQVLVTSTSVQSKHVTSKVDGRWAEILRDICTKYVRFLNFSKLVGLYLSKSLDMLDFICKGDGIFRDCINLNLPYFRIPEPESKFTFKFYLGR